MDSIGLIMALIKSMSHGVGKDGKSAYAYAVDGGYTGTEAEFAAKLAQEKYPNPAPLTFTGAVEDTYDGSEAKTVNIPSGVGGTEEYELICDLKIFEENVSEILISQDDNGNPLNLKKFRLEMRVKNGTSNTSSNFMFQINDQTKISGFPAYQAFTLRPFVAIGEIMCGKVNLNFVQPINGTTNNMVTFTVTNANQDISNFGDILAESVQKIYICPQTPANGAYFVSGTSFRLYGVRA